jgi:protein-S-isoprenylcysteine O-methyltransferase Ste14
MSAVEGDYGLWALVLANVLCFTGFATLLLKPVTRADWGIIGAFAVFVCAHFAERYGWPLSQFVLAGWLPLSPTSHDTGHVWPLVFGTAPHANPLHVAGYGFILGGYALLATASHTLHHAQRAGRLATDGVYARLRHPQMTALGLVMIGFVLQWPTAPTVALLPLLIAVAVRAAQADDETLRLQYGLAYAEYASATPAWVPQRSVGRACED